MRKLSNINTIAKKAGLIVMAFGDGGGSFSVFLKEDYDSASNIDTIFGLRDEDNEAVDPIEDIVIPQFKY